MGPVGNAFPREDTMTRSELLTARGYAPEVIAGDGNHVAASPVPSASPTARGCRGCGTAIDGAPTRLWCSNSCRKRHQARRPTDREVPTVPGPVRTPPGPDLLSQLVALAAELPIGWSVQVASDGAVLRWAPA